MPLAIGRRSHSRQPSNSIDALSRSKLGQLTHLLYMNTQIDYLDPNTSWLIKQADSVAKLHRSLLRPKGILSRLVISASEKGIPGLAECASLCPVHRSLEPRLVRALMMMVGREVTARVEKYRRSARSRGFDPAIKAWLLRVDSVTAMWTGEDIFSGVYDPSRRCEACILAVVGGRPQLLSDMRASLMARIEALKLETGEEIQPVLLRVVNSWISWYTPECRQTTKQASEELTRTIRNLDGEMKKRKEIRDTKRYEAGRSEVKQHVERLERDKGGLPLPPRARKDDDDGKFDRYSKDWDGVLDRIPGYVDCSSMFRQEEYEDADMVLRDQERIYQNYIKDYGRERRARKAKEGRTMAALAGDAARLKRSSNHSKEGSKSSAMSRSETIAGKDGAEQSQVEDRLRRASFASSSSSLYSITNEELDVPWETYELEDRNAAPSSPRRSPDGSSKDLEASWISESVMTYQPRKSHISNHRRKRTARKALPSSPIPSVPKIPTQYLGRAHNLPTPPSLSHALGLTSPGAPHKTTPRSSADSVASLTGSGSEPGTDAESRWLHPTRHSRSPKRTLDEPKRTKQSPVAGKRRARSKLREGASGLRQGAISRMEKIGRGDRRK